MVHLFTCECHIVHQNSIIWVYGPFVTVLNTCRFPYVPLCTEALELLPLTVSIQDCTNS